MASYEQYLQRQKNINSILEELRSNGPQTRRQLSKSVELSWGCVSELITMLIENSVITEEKTEPVSEKGRIPSVIRLNNKKLFLGVDVNKMGIKICECNLSGEKVGEYQFDICCNSGDDLYNSVIDSINSVYEKGKYLGMGVAMQGMFDERENVWIFPGEYGDLKADFKNELEKVFELPVIVEHDPNCILLGEVEPEKGKNIMMVRADKGIGVSMYSDGDFFKQGKLELGYTVVGDHRLYDVASIEGIEKVSGMSIDEIQEATCFETAGKYLGTALGNVCNLISIDEIILAGKLMQYSDRFMGELKNSYARTVIPFQRADIRVADVTDAAFGAAKLAVTKYPYNCERKQ